jgi:hypothetical protein
MNSYGRVRVMAMVTDELIQRLTIFNKLPGEGDGDGDVMCSQRCFTIAEDCVCC